MFLLLIKYIKKLKKIFKFLFYNNNLIIINKFFNLINY
jgi:hypothetical protein